MTTLDKNLTDILQAAAQRALQNNLSYAGALTPQEASQVLQSTKNALLVDVRTQAELELVGRVPNALNVEWATYPGMIANANFASQVADKTTKEQTLIFMCRTGGRSHSAAMVAASLGYHQAYNMLEGFEGEANALQQRTLINGWKHANLPWTHAK